MSKKLKSITQKERVDPWEALANAVVRQAVEDYKYLQKKGNLAQSTWGV